MSNKVRVAVLGSKDVGKTVVIHRLMYKEKEFKQWLGAYEPKETFGEEYVGGDFHFIEIGGNGSFKARRRCTYYREMDLDCFLVVFSIDEKSSVDNVVKRLVPEIKENVLFNIPIILLLNKSDLIPADIVGKVDKKIRSFVSDQELYMYLKLSSKTGDGYKQLFKTVKGLQGKGRSVPLIKTKQYVEKEQELKIRRMKALTKVEANELVYYSFHGDLEKVKELMADGANTNMFTQLGQENLTPFSAAVMNNNNEVVKEIMKNPEVIPSRFNMEGETALTYSCKYKYFDVLDTLLRCQRVKIDEKNKMFYGIVEVIQQMDDPEIKAVWDAIKAREFMYMEGIEKKDLAQIKQALYDPNLKCRVEIQEIEVEEIIELPDEEIIKPGVIDMDMSPPSSSGNVISMDDDDMGPPPEGEGEFDDEEVPKEPEEVKPEEKKPKVEVIVKKVMKPVLIVEHVTEERQPISKVPLVNIDCKNENGESALEVALKTGDAKVLDFLFSINGDSSRIRVEKDMVKLCHDMKETILAKKVDQTVQSVFVEILKGERRYFEKMNFMNRFYLLPIRQNLKKLVKKGKVRKDIIKYADLIFNIKKTSNQFLLSLASIYNEHYSNIRKGEAKEEVELQYKVVDLLRSLDYSAYLDYFEEDVLLSVDIKEEEHLAELYKFLLQCHKNIKLPREKANGFFVYTLNIKDRIMAYQNLLSRILKTTATETALHQQVDETLTFIKKTIHEFDDKVKNEKNMRRVETIMKTRYEMDSITQNKKRKYVHHQVDMDVLEIDGELLKDDKKKKKKKKKKSEKLTYSIFMFSDLMVFATFEQLNIFFFHDTKTVFIFNPKNVHVKVYNANTKTLLIELILVATLSKVEDMFRNMKEYYLVECENYYIPKISLINNLKQEEECDDFLKYDKNNVIDIVMYKRDMLAQKRGGLEKAIEEIEREDETYIEEVKTLRDRSMNKNQLKVEAHKMMQKYNPEKNVKNSPLIIKF